MAGLFSFERFFMSLDSLSPGIRTKPAAGRGLAASGVAYPAAAWLRPCQARFTLKTPHFFLKGAWLASVGLPSIGGGSEVERIKAGLFTPAAGFDRYQVGARSANP